MSKPAGWPAVTPRLIAEDPDALVAFLRTAFGAIGEAHAGRPTELRIDDAVVMVSGTFEGRGPTSTLLYLYLADVDAAYARALAAGASSHEAPRDLPWGDRRAIVGDPGGNVWQIATRAIATTTTRMVQHVRAPRAAVYRALVDAAAIQRWRVPDAMTSEVHAFEPRVGGAIRVSLTYSAPTGTGKTSAHTDTYRGHFVRLVPDEQVVEVFAFETTNPAMMGEMRVTLTLVDAPDGTYVIGEHEGVPAAVRPADNELGWRMSLAKLARLVES